MNVMTLANRSLDTEMADITRPRFWAQATPANFDIRILQRLESGTRSLTPWSKKETLNSVRSDVGHEW
ncbi:hypothetical protein DERF_004212 [Dermatophagoides farinae]|uniref:Uncharacterized protein n=1 Tax=Dermatophagoides farinae TaxID=6954 RepID=A0A922I103_DERFA|nr:hypothetical protein DERF_004212 [Dermatophagoides farinae]